LEHIFLNMTLFPFREFLPICLQPRKPKPKLLKYFESDLFPGWAGGDSSKQLSENSCKVRRRQRMSKACQVPVSRWAAQRPAQAHTKRRQTYPHLPYLRAAAPPPGVDRLQNGTNVLWDDLVSLRLAQPDLVSPTPSAFERSAFSCAAGGQAGRQTHIHTYIHIVKSR
jgi:hypothetical protein